MNKQTQQEANTTNEKGAFTNAVCADLAQEAKSAAKSAAHRIRTERVSTRSKHELNHRGVAPAAAIVQGGAFVLQPNAARSALVLSRRRELTSRCARTRGGALGRTAQDLQRARSCALGEEGRAAAGVGGVFGWDGAGGTQSSAFTSSPF